MITNKILALLTGFAAILITCIAAYFSIFGLSTLFAGSKLAVIIMATGLEFGKIILITYLYRNWKNINGLFKFYYVTGAIVLMSITSLGIYGFLNYSYNIIAKENIIANTEIKTLEAKKTLYLTKISNSKDNLTNEYAQLTQLNNLRSNNNIRLDSLYARNNLRAIRANESRLDKVSTTINDINTNISKITNEINIYNDSLAVYNNRIEFATNKITSSDLGPLIFVAKLFNTSIDVVVNILILLIIFVFDPLAIMLLIAFNNLDVVNKLYTKKEKIDVLENNKEIPEESNILEDDIPLIDELIPEEPPKTTDGTYTIGPGGSIQFTQF